jgi:hypothetical protein
VECVEDGGSLAVGSFVGVAGVCDTFSLDRYREEDPDVAALVDVYGQIGGNRGLRLRLIHGALDYVPVDVSSDFRDALAKEGYDVELTLWEGGHQVPVDLTVEQTVEVMGR